VAVHVVPASGGPERFIATLKTGTLSRGSRFQMLDWAGDDALVSAVAKLLDEEKDWALRVAAAEVLGSRSGAAPPVVVDALTRAATSDEYALVREAAVRALHAANPSAARPVLERLRETDPEPRVRDAAWQLIRPSK